jgi:hypothetical protein
MNPFLDGFADELIKLGKKNADAEIRKMYRDVRREQGDMPSAALSGLRGKGRQVSRDYLASMILGAATTPAMSLIGGKVSRGLHNRQILAAIKKAKTPKQIKQLRRELYTGKLIGSHRPAMRAQEKPILSTTDLAADASKGALYGSVLQMLRDRYSGSAGVG